MATTPFTALVGCAVPIQQAPMGGIAGPRLIEAVTKAGAMGMLTMTGAPADVLSKTLDALADAGARPVGVSFLVPFLNDAALHVAIEKAPLVDFYHAVPDEALIDRAKRGGALVEWQVGFPEHVDMAADMGGATSSCCAAWREVAACTVDGGCGSCSTP